MTCSHRPFCSVGYGYSAVTRGYLPNNRQKPCRPCFFAVENQTNKFFTNI